MHKRIKRDRSISSNTESYTQTPKNPRRTFYRRYKQGEYSDQSFHEQSYYPHHHRTNFIQKNSFNYGDRLMTEHIPRRPSFSIQKSFDEDQEFEKKFKELDEQLETYKKINTKIGNEVKPRVILNKKNVSKRSSLSHKK